MLTDELFKTDKSSLTDKLFEGKQGDLTSQLFPDKQVSAPTTPIPTISKKPTSTNLEQYLGSATGLQRGESNKYDVSLGKELVGVAKGVGEKIAATGELAMSLASSMALYIPSKLYGAMALPWGREAAGMAEESIAKLGYQPNTESGKAASELIGKGFELFLSPAKNLGEEVSKLSPRAGYLVEFGAELAEFALTGGIVRGAKAKFRPSIDRATRLINEKNRLEKEGIDQKIKETDVVEDEGIKNAQRKILEAEKLRSDLEKEKALKNLKETADPLVKDELVDKGEEVKKVKTTKPELKTRPVDVKPDYTFTSKKGHEYSKIDDVWYDSEGKEVRNNFIKGAAERGKVERVKPVTKRRPGKKTVVEEPTTDLDMQTGAQEPELIKGENSPFFQTKEATDIRTNLYEGKKIDDVEVMTMKLINDVNRWFHGEDVDIDLVRNNLSELATRAGELERTFDKRGDFTRWNEAVSEAATWARGLKKGERVIEPEILPKGIEEVKPSDIDWFGEGNDKGTRLNMMIPVDEIPAAVRGLVKEVKDIFRNSEIWEKTRFWLGRDYNWRYELGPGDVRPLSSATISHLNNGGASGGDLGAFIGNSKLFEIIPSLRDVEVQFGRGSGVNTLGTYDHSTNTIKVYGDWQNTFYHELQHAINEHTKAFRGSSPETQQIIGKGELILNRLENVKNKINKDNPNYDNIISMIENGVRTVKDNMKDVDIEAISNMAKWLNKDLADYLITKGEYNAANEAIFPLGRIGDAFTRYKKVPGEMEARLTERRMKMTEEQKAAEPPWNTLDKMLREEGLITQQEHITRTGAGVKLYSGIPLDEAYKLAKKVLLTIKTPKRVEKFVRDKFPELISDDIKIVWLNELSIPKDWPAMASAKFDWLDNTVWIAPNTKKRIKAGKPSLTEAQIAESLVHELQHLNESNAVSTLEEFIERKKLNPGENPDYATWRGAETEKGPIEKGRIARAMFEDVLAKEISTGTKLYDIGGATAEGVKQIIKGAGDFANYLREAKAYRQFKPKEVAKVLNKELKRDFVDRSGNIRVELLNSLGDEGYKIIQKMYLSKGASSISANMLKQMQKEVYRGLSRQEKEILDGIILSDRMADIASYKTSFKFPDYISSDGKVPDKSISWRETFKQRYKLSDKKAIELEDKAKTYFWWMKRPLKDMLDAGLISPEDFDALSKHNYRRIKLADIFDKRYQAKIGAKKRTVYDSGVEALSHGRTTDIYESSSEIMALEVFNRAYGRILNNAANKTLLDLARRDYENPFVRIKDNEHKIPSGWSRLFLYENGERKSIYLSPEMSKEWIVSNPEMSYRLSQLIRVASGSSILRTFATGINWGFAVANLPRDIMHAWFTARVYENGEWRGIYSPHAPIYGLQISKDLATVFTDALLRKGRYQDYINEGGGMEFLVHQGRILQRGRHLEGPLDKVQNFLGYFGETSEIMTRLAIRERVMKQGKSSEEATFAARDYMDFGQGGSIAKALDNGIPYLNASIQGTRGMFRAFKDNPLVSTYKLSQFAALTAGVYIAMKSMSPETEKNLRGNIDMTNNLVIPLGDQFGFLDNEGQMRYPYVKIPLDPGQKFFKKFFEASTDKWLGNEVDVGGTAAALKELSPVPGVSGMLPPSISSVLGYVTNKDFWRNEDIWKQSEPFSFPASKEEYTSRTPEAFIDIGQATGLSPERLRYSVSELVTNGTVWSYLLGQGYEATFGDLPKEKKEQHLAMVLSKMPVTKRFIGVTNPYGKHAEKIDKAQEGAVLKQFVENRNFDILVEGYLYGEGVSRDEVIKNASSYKDRDTYDRLIDRFKFEEAIKDLPEKSFWRRMKGLRTEAKAEVFVDRLRNADEKEKEQLWQEYGIISMAKGVISPEFRREVVKLLGK